MEEISIGAPYGNRTRVSAVKGRCPGPLDEGRSSDAGRHIEAFGATGKQAWAGNRAGHQSFPRHDALTACAPLLEVRDLQVIARRGGIHRGAPSRPAS